MIVTEYSRGWVVLFYSFLESLFLAKQATRNWLARLSTLFHHFLLRIWNNSLNNIFLPLNGYKLSKPQQVPRITAYSSLLTSPTWLVTPSGCWISQRTCLVTCINRLVTHSISLVTFLQMCNYLLELLCHPRRELIKPCSIFNHLYKVLCQPISVL